MKSNNKNRELTRIALDFKRIAQSVIDNIQNSKPNIQVIYNDTNGITRRWWRDDSIKDCEKESTFEIEDGDCNNLIHTINGRRKNER